MRKGKQIFLQDYKNERQLECSRLIYRFPSIRTYQDAVNYFQKPGVLDYCNTSKIEEGFYYLENEGQSIFVQPSKKRIEITICKEESTHSILLNKEDLINLTDALTQFIGKM